MAKGAVSLDDALGGPTRAAYSELWVCFEPPSEDPPEDVLVLSFVGPVAEHELQQRCGARMLSGRTLMPHVRGRARDEYVRLMGRLGTAPFTGNRTLRQALKGAGAYSRWWLLDPTEKDCLVEEETTYLAILRLMAVRMLKERHGIERVRVHGALPTSGGVAPLARAVAAGIVGRVLLLRELLATWWSMRRLPAPAEPQLDVLLQGYWDWTVRPDANGGLLDRYFTDLPAQLAARNLRAGWLAACEPHAQAWQRGRSRREVIAAAGAYPQVVLLERDLTPGDIVRTIANVRDAIVITRAVAQRQFQDLCRVDDVDLSSLIRARLLRAVWGATFCRLQLVATATARACQRLRPAVVLTAFELFVRSRAFYAGVRSWSPRARLWAAQHAGYSTDKTLGAFEPDVELRGQPDGCAVPAPDGIFTMGQLSRRIWERSGFRPGEVVVTGGLRYQAVRAHARAARRGDGSITILLAGGMHDASHFDLCEAAVAATAGMPSVRLLWRDHPVYPLSHKPAFNRFRRAIAVSSGSVDEDFESADLVLFSQTGLAEEALLRGIPTWQWLWAGFNTSPFLDLQVIPSFTSVAALRRELEAFRGDPAAYDPSPETQRLVLLECFGPDPANASARIAEAVHHMIGVEAAVHA